MTEGYIFSLSTFRGGGRGGGGPKVLVSDFQGEYPVSDFREGGGSQSQILGGGGGGYPVSAKGKIFDTRFGLIHVQTRKKIFVEGPPPTKGKKF